MIKQFSNECWKELGLYQFCFTLLCDWYRKLVPLSNQVRNKNQPRLSRFWYNWSTIHDFIGWKPIIYFKDKHQRT